MASVWLLAACATSPTPPAVDGWHNMPLPGKQQTLHETGRHEGRKAVIAHANRSASMWRRKIVVDSGMAQVGRWRDHGRDPSEDFRLAFGEASGALISMAVMADSDNTQSTARSWFGDIQLHQVPDHAPNAAPNRAAHN